MMKIQRQNAEPVALNVEQLVVDLLGTSHDTTAENWWRKECVIIVDYMPPNPGKDTRPKCVIKHLPTDNFLRYSKGPAQGYFWDCYGDDFFRPELAIVALSRAAKPFGKPYVEFKIPLPPKS